MIFGPAQWQALAPMVIVGAGSVAVMLLIAATRNHRATAQLTSLVLIAALAVTLLLPQVAEASPLLIFDRYAHAVTALLLGAGLITTFLFYGYIADYAGNKEELYLLLLLAVLGGLVLAAARHAASLLLGLEILTMALYGMIAYPVRNKKPLEAGIKYLVLSAVASATLLFGFALVYTATGTLRFDELATALSVAAGPDRLIAEVGSALLWIGLGFKLSLVPFHLWTADVYEGAPAPVTAFLATASKGAVAAVLLRYTAAEPLSGGLYEALWAVAIASILIGNVLALLAGNVKRLLAYSSIANIGYLIVPFIVGGGLAVEAVLFYLYAYFVMTLGSFGVVTLLSHSGAERDADQFWDYRGLFWRRPYITSVFTPMLLALAGVPLTAGFLAKFYVLAVGVDTEAWLLVAAIVIGSAIGLYYYLRLIITLFLQRPGMQREGRLTEATITGGAVLSILFVLLFWWGVLPDALMRWLAAAALAGG